MTAFLASEQPLPGITGAPLHGPAAHWSRYASLPACVLQHLAAGRQGDVGPEGHPPFMGRIFRACIQTGTGPVQRHSRQVSQHTMPETGRSPGLPAGPGCFLVTAEKFACFPPSETPSEFLIRGLFRARVKRKASSARVAVPVVTAG